MASSKNWIVAARTDGFGARMCALLNAMVISKLTNITFKFAWIPPHKAPYLSENSKNLENNQVLIPFANLPLKDELFSQDFIKKYALTDEYIGNEGQFENINLLQDYKNPPKLFDFGYYCNGALLDYSDLDKKQYRKLLKEAFSEIDFATRIKEIIKDATKCVKSLKKDFVAFHIRAGDIVYADTFAPFVNKNTAFSVYLALKIAEIELQNGKEIVLFGDDLAALKIIKDSLNSKSVHCIDDFFKRDELKGYEQSIFEITFMSFAKKICNGGSSGFSGLAQRIGDIKEHGIPLDYFTKEQQLEILQNSINAYDFHPAHKAYAYMQMLLLGIDLGLDSNFLLNCARNCVKFYDNNFYMLVLSSLLLLTNDLKGADEVLERAYKKDCEGFLQKLILSRGYTSDFLAQGFIAYFKTFSVQCPYLAYFAFRMALMVAESSKEVRETILGADLILQYINDYYRIATFLLKAQEIGQFSEIYLPLKSFEIEIVAKEINTLKENYNKIIEFLGKK